MNITERIKHYAYTQPDVAAIKSGDQSISYKELDEKSDCLASYIDSTCGENKTPIPIYGHKSIYIIVCMLAVVKSGRAYCPIDVSVPDMRVQAILDKIGGPLMLAPEKTNCKYQRIIEEAEIKRIIRNQEKGIAEDKCVNGDEVFYIIFTSGSTGEPKGVEITESCLGNYLDWSIGLVGTPQNKEGKTFLNQAPFSFDLSVMDLYTCLASGGTLWTLTKEVQGDYKLLMESLEKSKAAVWVSTPSFADICLADKQFGKELMSKLETFLFCGETLTKDTAVKLRERFSGARVVNLYGPTESTVAVTAVEISGKMCEDTGALPVGMAKLGTIIEIVGGDGNKLPEGEKGEIVILGDTVSSGYYREEELTKRAFFKKEIQGETIRGYRTGDEGYLDGGMLHYCGRIDLQVKLHGYRIEIEDIESNLLKLPEIDKAVVVANSKDGKVKSLSAYIIYKEENKGETEETGESLEKPEQWEQRKKIEKTAELKQKLKQFLPDYMIPKKFVFMEEFPINANGKTDRKLMGRTGS